MRSSRSSRTPGPAPPRRVEPAAAPPVDSFQLTGWTRARSRWVCRARAPMPAIPTPYRTIDWWVRRSYTCGPAMPAVAGLKRCYRGCSPPGCLSRMRVRPIHSIWGNGDVRTALSHAARGLRQLLCASLRPADRPAAHRLGTGRAVCSQRCDQSARPARPGADRDRSAALADRCAARRSVAGAGGDLSRRRALFFSRTASTAMAATGR